MTIHEIRYQNLLLLISECKTAKALSEKTGVAEAYISQIKNRRVGAKMKNPQSVGEQTARQLEKGMQKEKGWMDKQHNNESQVREPLAEYTVDKVRELSQSEQVMVLDYIEKHILKAQHKK